MRYDVLTGGPRPLTVIVADDDSVVAAGFTGLAALQDRVGVTDSPAQTRIEWLRKVWVSYLNGDLAAFDQMNIRQQGSPIQAAVWDSLRQVPPGEPLSYSQLAEEIGKPRAARAVGSACGANRVAPFVPCHRVIAADGSLGGYGYGLVIKQWLLSHEGVGE